MIDRYIERTGEHAVPMHLVCHRSTAKVVIINCPGYNGDIDGYNLKYRVLGEHLASREVGAIIQMPNITRPTTVYGRELVKDVKAVIEYAIQNATDFCDSDEPEIYLMGFSAGGFAVAAAASTFVQVTKLLLMEPSASTQLMGTFPSEVIAEFEGSVYIVLGDHDGVGLPVGEKYCKAFSGASRREMVVIPNCDHQFQGSLNGQIMAKAPLWAFAGDTTFPSADGGLVLY